jgi:hypothetical protein
MKYILNITTGVIAALAVLAFIALYIPTQNVESAGYFGYAARIQSATTTSIGGQVSTTIFSASVDDSCKSRIVTTGATPIRLSFGEVAGFSSTTLSASVGHYQAASTTIAYDSGLYGCGWWTGRAIGATTTVTITEL